MYVRTGQCAYANNVGGESFNVTVAKLEALQCN